MLQKESFFKRHLWLSAFGATALCFLAMYVAMPVYLTPDDRFAMYALAGYYSGIPQPIYPFINVVFGTVISSLYGVTQNIPWYPLVMLIIMYMSSTAILYSVMAFFTARKFPRWAVFAAAFLSFFAMVLTLNTIITFTTVSCLCGTAAIVLLLAGSMKSGRKLLPMALSALLLVLGYIIRDMSALVCSCFYMLTVLYLFVRRLLEDRRFSRQALAILLCACLSGTLILSCRAINNHAKDTEDYRACQQWSSMRSAIVDYKELTYQQDPEYYESIGWSEEYYKLVRAWYFIDDKTDAETLTAIHEHALERKQPQTILGACKTMLATLKSKLTIPMWSVVLLELMALICACIVLALRRRNKNGWLLLAYAVCAFGGMLLTWLYLSYIGRFRHNVFFITSIPTVFILLLCVVQMLPERVTEETANKRNTVFGWLAAAAVPMLSAGILYAGGNVSSRILRLAVLAGSAVIVCALLVFACVKIRRGSGIWRAAGIVIVLGIVTLCWSMNSYSETSYDSENDTWNHQLEVTERYALEHPEEILVTGHFMYNRDASTLFTQGMPTNLFSTIDYMKYTNAYKTKLALNGVEDLTIQSYFEPGVYYVGNTTNEEFLPLLMAYMQKEYGQGVTVQVHAQLDYDVCVFEFHR